MSIISILILSIHYLLVSILCIYGAHRIYHSLMAKRLIGNLTDHQTPTLADLIIVPKVTVQIPLYNEKFVAARIIDRVAKLCLLYTSPSPRDKRQSRMPSSA